MTVTCVRQREESAERTTGKLYCDVLIDFKTWRRRASASCRGIKGKFTSLWQSRF